MMRTGGRKLHVFRMTYKDDAHGNESDTIQLGSESASTQCKKKSQPAAVVTRREQGTHCGSEFEISDILTLMKEDSINLR